MTQQSLMKTMEKFEEIGLLSIATGSVKNPAFVKTGDIFTLAVQETTMEITHGTLCRTSNVLWNTMHKIVRKFLQFYPYKIKHVQELQK